MEELCDEVEILLMAEDESVHDELVAQRSQLDKRRSHDDSTCQNLMIINNAILKSSRFCGTEAQTGVCCFVCILLW